jgi:hypothetical protein
MATFKGSEGVVKVGGNAIAEIRSFSIEESADTIEDTAMGDTSRTYKSSLKSFTASIDALFDDTDTNGQVAMTIGSELAFEFQPEGSAPSSDYELAGTGIVTGISQSQSYDSLVEVSFTIQGTGALTRHTVGS